MGTEVITTLSFEELKNLISECVRRELNSLLPPMKEHEEEVNNRLISKTAAAKLLGCSTGTIDNYARSGDLKRFYVGRSVRFYRDQVISMAKTMRK